MFYKAQPPTPWKSGKQALSYKRPKPEMPNGGTMFAKI